MKVFPGPQGSDHSAVDGVDLRIEAGEIYGLLGPNGAGKTTTLRLLSGIMSPTSGRARVCGFEVSSEPVEVRKRIGFLTANTGLYPRLTPREALTFFGEMHGLQRRAARARAIELLNVLDMAAFADHRCGALSTGQRQRVNIARSLVADPQVLILDEPTLGLDVLSNRLILDFIRCERRAGKSILLSTHHMHEAEDLCDRIGLMHEGRIVAEGTLDALRAQSGRQRLSDVFLDLIGQSVPT